MNKYLYFYYCWFYENSLIFILFLCGFTLRLFSINQTLWIDEVLLTEWIRRGTWFQEQIPIFIGHITTFLSQGEHREFWLKLPYIAAGSLMILVPQYVFKDKRLVFCISAFIAFFPLFVFWSGIARPYMMASFFVALSFTKWNKGYGFNFLSLLVTPFALLGFNFIQFFKNRKKRTEILWLIFFVLVGIVLFKIRPDSDREFFNTQFLTHVKRLWCIPVTAGIFYIGGLVQFLLDRKLEIRIEE